LTKFSYYIEGENPPNLTGKIKEAGEKCVLIIEMTCPPKSGQN